MPKLLNNTLFKANKKKKCFTKKKITPGNTFIRILIEMDKKPRSMRNNRVGSPTFTIS